MKKLLLIILILSFPVADASSAIIYSNNFESDDGGLIQIDCINYSWEWGIPKYVGPSNVPSGQRCWGTIIEGNYGSSTTNREYLVLTNVDLTSVSYAGLEFWHYYKFDDMMTDDAGRVEVSTNSGTTWSNLGDYPYEYSQSWVMAFNGPGYARNEGTNWQQAAFDLTSYAGQNIWIRFRFESDSWNNNHPGWYIDDLVIKDIPVPIAGTGTSSNMPVSVYNNSSNAITFYYKAEKGIYSGKVSLEIPAGWSAPQDSNGALEGYVQIQSGTGSPVIALDPDIVLRTITVQITNMKPGDDLRIIYGAGAVGAVAPSSYGTYSFTMQSGNILEGMVDLDESPWVAVQPLIVPPYFENFESGVGGLYATGEKAQWEYGTPSGVGPSSAHSGSSCWATKISSYYDINFWNPENLYLPPIDLTGITTNVYISFWHWFEFYYDRNMGHDGSAIFASTNGGTNYFILEAHLGTRYNDTSDMMPPFGMGGTSPYCWSLKNSGWEQVYVDLTSFTNKVVNLYFAFKAGNWQFPNFAGYYLDDIEVIASTPPVAGSGQGSIQPAATYISSTNYYKLKYTSDTVIYNGTVTVDIPGGWTPPQMAIPANPGYVYIVSTNSAVKINKIPGVGGNTITINITNMPAGMDFDICYSNAVAQNTTGPAQFITRSMRQGEVLTPINKTPEVRVMNLISSFPWFRDFEGNDGNLSTVGNLTPFWEWGVPGVGPTGAYSGSRCWGTLLNSTLDPDYQNYSLYTPFFNFSNITNAIIDFQYFADLQGSGSFGAHFMISTNKGQTFEVFGKYPTDYDEQWFYSPPPYTKSYPGWADSTTAWEQKIIDLSSLSGKILQMRFRFVNRGWEPNHAGFYIDDLYVKRDRPPIAGSGTATVNPSVTAPSTSADYAFLYLSEKNFYDGSVTFEIPNNWTAPQKIFPANPGYIKIISVLSNAKVNYDLNIIGAGPWIVTVTVTNIPAEGGFTLAYSNAVSPALIGESVFSVRSALDTEPLTEINSSPVIVNLNTISIPFTHTFDSDNGGWVEAGSTHELWDWGIPSWGPSSAHSGSRLWGTVLDDNVNVPGVLDKLTSPIIDLTSATQAHFAFYHWYDMSDMAMSDMAGNVMVSTNFTDFAVLGSYPKNYPNSWVFSWSGPKNGQDGYSGMDWENQKRWEKRTFNLLPYVGNKIILRFDFGSRPAAPQLNSPGWYIDDVSVQPTPPPIAGTGTATIYPESAIVNTTNNYTITYTAKEDIFIGSIEIDFPHDWSLIQTNNSSGRGYVFLDTFSTFTYNLTIANSNRLIINVQNLDYNESFQIRYKKAVTPAVAGTYVFTNKSQGFSEPITPIDNSPSVICQEIQTLPYKEEFESGNGGYISEGNDKLFEWGTPANVGPSEAHSGIKCWGTKINQFYNEDNSWEYMVSPPFDVTAETQIYFSFHHYFDSEADPMKMFPWGSGDGVTLEIASADTLAGLTTASFEQVGSYPQVYNQYLDNRQFWGGFSGGWVRQEMNLSQYGGKYIKFRFYFHSDWDYASLPGWYVDDIKIDNVTPKTPDVPFEDSGTHIGRNNSYGVSFLDFDNDGDFDLIENNYKQTYNIIWRNNGSGSLSEYKSIGKNSTRVIRFADFNNDGFYDAFAGNCKGEIGELSEQPNEIFMNAGGKEFVLKQSIGNDITRDVALCDVDNDGDVDIFVANIGANSLYLNDGTGNFQESENILTGGNTTAALFADFNNDAYMDLVIGNNGGEANRLLMNNGSGGFSDSGQSMGKYETTSLDVGDIDLDGDLDIVFGTRTLIKIWTNNGSAGFGSAGSSRFQARSIDFVTNDTKDMKLADVDNDGDLDILCANEYDTDMVWLNNGFGTFKDSGNYLGSYASKRMSVADFNRDGLLDFAVGNSFDQPDIIWLNKMTNNNINRAPSPPKVLEVEFSGNEAIITWSSGTDSETPISHLTYNLNIGTSPNGNDILSVPVKKDSYYFNGPGNVRMAKVSGGNRIWRIKNLTKISYYYFSVQTIDEGFMGSTWLTASYYHDPKAPGVDDFKTSDNFLNLDDGQECIITYNLGQASKVTIEIVNLEGTIVKTLLKDVQKPAGYHPYTHKETWKGINEAGTKIAPGIYWVFVKTDHWVKKKRVLIVW
ncbi:MAG: VCBS repeat-containing protein [Spirochaetes bacterium]|nr:VCBS repeat-containing protein [Spirochaetota bacterium]